MEKNNSEKHLFSNHDLWMLLVPLVVEQLLNSLMGTADSIMVSNVGSAAISAVSLVDSINILVIQAFYALAAYRGAVIRNEEKRGTIYITQNIIMVVVHFIGFLIMYIVYVYIETNL